MYAGKCCAGGKSIYIIYMTYLFIPYVIYMFALIKFYKTKVQSEPGIYNIDTFYSSYIS